MLLEFLQPHSCRAALFVAHVRHFHFVAGTIGEATGGHDGAMSKQGLLDIYELFGWISIGVAVGVLLLSPIVKRWMHLDTLKDREVDDDLLGDVEVGEPQAAGAHPATRPAG